MYRWRNLVNACFFIRICKRWFEPEILMTYIVLRKIYTVQISSTAVRLVASVYSPTEVELIGELSNYNFSIFQKVCYNFKYVFLQWIILKHASSLEFPENCNICNNSRMHNFRVNYTINSTTVGTRCWRQNLNHF